MNNLEMAKAENCLVPEIPNEAQPQKQNGFGVLLSVSGAILLLVSEIWSIAAAGVWAVAGLFHLPTILTIMLAILVGVAALWGSWIMVQLAIAAERAD